MRGEAPPRAPILPRDAAVRWRAAQRASGRRVVFTNGCFDLLHIGHLALLEAARGAGDALIVALNTDASVVRLKGPGRPLVAEGERAAVIAALRCVDAVTSFDEDTPAELIAALLPDVLVKGGDYTATTVVGHECVRAAGGQVLIVPLVPGHSTTALAARAAGA